MNSYFKFLDTRALDEKAASGIFPFGQNLFWDTPVQNIHLQQHKRYIIERVLTRGFLQDFYLLLKIYTIEQIKEAVVKNKELDPRTAHFCSEYFQIPKEQIPVSSFYH
ncbi:MAG: hypothetical protein K2X48_18245 [Chitinophagaceae bacterium]|nr:hypothetical protein [Chitinophagaceae bacterium]